MCRIFTKLYTDTKLTILVKHSHVNKLPQVTTFKKLQDYQSFSPYVYIFANDFWIRQTMQRSDHFEIPPCIFNGAEMHEVYSDAFIISNSFCCRLTRCIQ